MSLEAHRPAIYGAFSVYGVILVGCAAWAHHRMARLERTGAADKLTSHYLGGRNFGPLVTMGTLFASQYSGYTVVGIPNEAYYIGFLTVRWIAIGFSVVLGVFVMGIRMRKAGDVRNHSTPVDFITDRFQSQTLRYIIVGLQIGTTVIYLAAQVIALKGTFNMIFGLDPDSPVAAICIMAVIMVFEWVGGLSSVALTDCIQGFVMLVSFLLLPFVMLHHFGGWEDLDPETFPRPELYRTPTKEQQWMFWQISLIGLGFSTLPHLIQRTYAARDLASIKFGYLVLGTAMWYTTFSSIFIGIVGIVALKGEVTASPVTSILGKLCDEGGFTKTLAVITITASMAAVMSTADSLLIAISQLVTVEIACPLWPEATPSQLAWFGRFCSLFSTAFALLLGLFWEDGIGDLAITQIDLSLQAIPAFWWGLYASEKTDVHPWCLCIGSTVSTLYVLFFNYMYLEKVEEPLAINAGVTGFVMQVVVVLIAEFFRRLMCDTTKNATSIATTNNEIGTDNKKMVPVLLFPNRPSWDIPQTAKYGVHALSPQFMWKMMDGVNEPLANPWVAFLFFFSVTMITPMVPEMEPEDLADVNVVNGLPWWVFKSLILSVVPEIVFLAALYKTSSRYPKNDAVDNNNLNCSNTTIDEGESSNMPSDHFVELLGAVEEKPVDSAIERDDNRPVLRRRRSLHRIMAKYGVPEVVIDRELSRTSGITSTPHRIGSGVLLQSGESVEITA